MLLAVLIPGIKVSGRFKQTNYIKKCIRQFTMIRHSFHSKVTMIKQFTGLPMENSTLILFNDFCRIIAI